MSGPIRWPANPTPPTRVGPPPKPVLPPTPVLPPGTPPAPIGDVTVTPVVPPGPPVEPVPPQYQTGYWSDGWAVVRQSAGTILVTLSSGITVPFDIRRAGELAPDITNSILGVIGLAARATTVEPWPVRPNTAQKASKEMFMYENTTLADVMAEIAQMQEVLSGGIEQIQKDISLIHESMAGALPETPEAQDHWAAAFGLAGEPAGLDVPLETFSPERAALYAVFARSVINGTQTWPGPHRVALARELALGEPLDRTGQTYLDLCVKYGVDRDVAIFALLTGLIDPFESGLAARLERDVSMLAGTYKAEILSDGSVASRWIPLTFEGAYKMLLPSGSGGQAGQGGA